MRTPTTSSKNAATARKGTGALVTYAFAAGIASITLAGVPADAAAVVRTATETTTIDVVAINDFHGRIEASPENGIAGAAVLAGAIAELRREQPNTIFVSAGDNIGASTFTSFIADDRPTIEALVTAGLQVSAVGNHEFDHGFTHLDTHVRSWYGAADPALSNSLVLGANVRDAVTGDPLLPEYAIVEQDGVRIGFIGTVTEDTATSVNPALIDGVAFTSQRDAAQRVAAEIDDRVDATILLTHDGSPSADCSALTSEPTVFGELIREATPMIDAVISAHTHQTYSCEVAGRPVVQSGSYGAALSQISLEFDRTGATPRLTGAASDVIPLIADEVPRFAADPKLGQLVADAQAHADALGAEPVGRISADIERGGSPAGTDRSVESMLGNLIADITVAAIPGADIGLMNQGGLREDLRFTAPDGIITYRDVANVQPFANTIMTVDLTGAQLAELLEQQWQMDRFEHDTGEPVTTEVRRNLAVSERLSYTYAPDAPLGERIISLSMDGAPIDPQATYTVATISFLMNGGDGLSVLQEGTNLRDSGRNDLQITMDYFAAHDVVDPPPLGRSTVAEGEPETGTIAGNISTVTTPVGWFALTMLGIALALAAHALAGERRRSS